MNINKHLNYVNEQNTHKTGTQNSSCNHQYSTHQPTYLIAVSTAEQFGR
jgi:hypothetical protein